MNTQEKDKMAYVPHRISKKQQFCMDAFTKIQKNKRAYGDQLRAMRGITEQENFWERKKISLGKGGATA